MLSPIIRSAFIAILLAAAPAFAAEAPKKEEAVSSRLLVALEKADHEAFVADGDAAFKQLPKAQFEAAVVQIAPRLKEGYEMSFLGELKQRGYQVTLWKLSFKNGGDDALATLSVKDGKVGGFWIK